MLWNNLSPVWQACVCQAWEAMCANTFPIGAVIVDADGEIVARGRNRVFDGPGASGSLHGSMLAHAEMNALIDLAQNDRKARDCVLYTSLEPCPMCLGAIRMSAMPTVHVAARDPLVETSKMASATAFMRRRPVELLGPDNLLLEQVLVVWHTIFIRSIGASWDSLVEPLATTEYLAAVKLGRKMAETGEWQALAGKGWSAAEAVEALAVRMAG